MQKMNEHYNHSDEEYDMVAAEAHNQALEAVYGVLKGKGDCPGCYSDTIIVGMADALAQLIVERPSRPGGERRRMILSAEDGTVPFWKALSPSPWYYDNNVPSLYRARCMVVAAMAGLAINRGHELAERGFEFLRHFRLQLPNTFATLPPLLKRWEAAWSARIDAGIAGVLEVEQPKDAAEIDSLNAWTAACIREGREAWERSF
jgi:hypothetical protein